MRSKLCPSRGGRNALLRHNSPGGRMEFSFISLLSKMKCLFLSSMRNTNNRLTGEKENFRVFLVFILAIIVQRVGSDLIIYDSYGSGFLLFSWLA